MEPRPTPRRRAAELLKRMSALDGAGDHPVIDLARGRLHQQAASLGLRFVSMTITEGPIPDPAIEALPRAVIDRIAAISRAMLTRPEAHVAELEALTKRYPHIPMLRNHLAGALRASGQGKRAERLVARTAREFPTYVFAFCSYVLMLLEDGRIDEARSLVETGPRGPVFTLTDFDATRDTFHISEARSHALMVGRYMLATGRREAAQVQLDMLKKAAPRSLEYRSLAAAMRKDPDLIALAAALLRFKANAELRAERRAAKEAKAAGKVACKPKGKAPKQPASAGPDAPKATTRRVRTRMAKSDTPELFGA